MSAKKKKYISVTERHSGTGNFFAVKGGETKLKELRKWAG